ncbi:hypothetical protein Naga_100622g3 [Nannochloropsis gaditana]|uniref:Uncharacterized protein n=1 Tax=Nannochloropsis gaditana TaxID=72520 RepID=W7T0Z9_9STRA|nr:hypothetical protein Naga_100622g3 [Nannochloropsis gaditana]
MVSTRLPRCVFRVRVYWHIGGRLAELIRSRQQESDPFPRVLHSPCYKSQLTTHQCRLPSLSFSFLFVRMCSIVAPNVFVASPRSPTDRPGIHRFRFFLLELSYFILSFLLTTEHAY